MENMLFPVVLDEQTFGAKKQVTWDKNHLCVSKANRAAIIILFGKERRLIHSQEGRNDQVARRQGRRGRHG